MKLITKLEHTPYYVATALLLPVLAIQAFWVKAKVLRLPEPSGERSGKQGSDGNELSILVLGDSAAAGVGVEVQEHALTCQLAENLATKYQVNWQLVAKTGFTSKDIIQELNTLPEQTFDYVVVSVGVNDVTHLTSMKRWNSNIQTIVNVIKDKFNSPAVLLTCVPPMQLFKSLPYPLSWWLGLRAKRFNNVMAEISEDKTHCSLLSFDLPFEPEFLAQDGFHPSNVAYRIWANQAADKIEKPFN